MAVEPGLSPRLHPRPQRRFLTRALQVRLKRFLDVASALVLLVILAPLGVLLAAIIRVSSPGPVLFRQERAGRDGRAFVICKFRTMRVKSRDGETDEERLTGVGRWLRAWSLDELPQLWNVLKGDMSLVGPRPTLLYQVEMYSARQRKRLDMRPGITGLAQVSGRNTLPWSHRIRLDVAYVEHWSLAVDLRILWRTLGVVATREGSRHEELGDETEDFAHE